MSIYASLFKENNITGKRLLLLEEEDFKDMGIVSKGHIIHLVDGSPAGTTQPCFQVLCALSFLPHHSLVAGSALPTPQHLFPCAPFT